MHFTVVFDGPESGGSSYELQFIPGPCWTRGNEILVNMSVVPGYQLGGLQLLFDALGRPFPRPSDAAVVVHHAGHGTEGDLANLLADLRVGGFGSEVVRLDDVGTAQG